MQLGDSFQLGSTYSTLFKDGSYTGANSYLVTGFNPDCNCLEVQSDEQNLNR